MNSIYLKILYDKRWFSIWWSVGLFALGLIMVSFYPSFTKDDGLNSLLESIPTELQAIVGDAASLRTVEGYMASQVFDLRVPLVALIATVVLFFALSGGEEKNGTLQTLTITPRSRTRIAIETFAAGMSILLVLFVSLYVSLVFGLSLIGETMDQTVLFALTFSSYLIALVAGSFVFMLSLGFGWLKAASGITASLLIGLYLLFAFSLSVEWLEPFKVISPFNYNDPRSIAQNGYSAVNTAVLVVSIIVFLAITIFTFKRRDLA